MSSKEIAKSIIELLQERNELHLLNEVVLELKKALKNQYQVASITSAAPLDQELKQRVESKIFSKYPEVDTVVYRVDKELLGGLIINVGGVQRDLSLRSRLAQIKKELTK